MTALAQGEQGKVADNRGERPVLRGWLHVVAFVGWLIGGPFLDRRRTGRLGGDRAHRLRRGHAGHVRHQCGLPPNSLVGSGVAPHAAGGPQCDLRGHRRHVHRRGRPGADRLVAGVPAQPGVGRRGRRDRAPSDLARRSAVGGRHPLRGRGVVPLGGGTPAGAERGLGRVLAHVGGWVRRHGRGVGLRARVAQPVAAFFGFHEVFHACTLVGAALFAYLVVYVVLPRY